MADLFFLSNELIGDICKMLVKKIKHSGNDSKEEFQERRRKMGQIKPEILRCRRASLPWQ